MGDEERVDLLMDELNLSIPALIVGDSVKEEYNVGCGKPYEFTGERVNEEVIVRIKVPKLE